MRILLARTGSRANSSMVWSVMWPFVLNKICEASSTVSVNIFSSEALCSISWAYPSSMLRPWQSRIRPSTSFPTGTGLFQIQIPRVPCPSSPRDLKPCMRSRKRFARNDLPVFCVPQMAMTAILRCYIASSSSIASVLMANSPLASSTVTNGIAWASTP